MEKSEYIVCNFFFNSKGVKKLECKENECMFFVGLFKYYRESSFFGID